MPTATNRNDPNYTPLPYQLRWDGTRWVRSSVAPPGIRIGGRSPIGGTTGPTYPGEGGQPVLGQPPVTGSPGSVGTSAAPGQSLIDKIQGALSNPDTWAMIMEILGNQGQVLGATASSAAAGRRSEAQLLAQRDLASNMQYNTQQNAQFNAGHLDLNRKDFEERARSTRARQGVVGNLLNNVQDFKLNIPGVQSTSMGGLRPSALGEGGRQAGAELARQAMLRQMTPETYTGGQILEPPPLSPIPQPSGWERAAGIGGALASIGAGLAPLFRRRRQPPPPPVPPGPTQDGV